VVDPSNAGRVLGILSQRDIVAAYTRRRFDTGPSGREGGALE
jgi:CBS domain-containing protein